MLNLLIMGDSIAKGYGSSEKLEGGFGTILGEKLSANVTNLGIIGLDSKQLLEKLSTEKFQEAVKDADVLCLSIGSNDLLKPFLAEFADVLGVEGEEKELFKKIQDKMSKTAKKNPISAANMLSSAMKKLTNNPDLNKACEQFPDRFNEIITKIHDINPDIIIYADNIYNPYFGVAYEYGGISIFNVQQLCEPYIQKLNQTFVKCDEYEYIDIYSIFRQPGYTNVNAGSFDNMGEINLDPHPNDAGYQLMADYIYTHFDSVVPEITGAIFDCDTDIETIILNFSEEVRLVSGGRFVIKSEDGKEIFTYNIDDNYWVKEDGNDEKEYSVSLKLSDFAADSDNSSDKLQAGNTYVLYAEDGSVKDKHNNHLKNYEILQFTIPAQENDTVTQTVASDNLITILSDGNNIGVLVVGILCVLIIVAAVIIIIRKKLK